jgi:hypothetical protein
MSEDLFDEVALRRALRLEPGERVRLDARALAAAAESAAQARLVRWILSGLAAALVVPALGIGRAALALAGDPSLASDPLALAGLAGGPLRDGLAVLAQPATALAIVAGLAIFTACERREGAHAHAARA